MSLGLEKGLLLLVLLFLRQGAAVPLSEFYPFGQTVGDFQLESNDDGSSLPVTLSIPFRYFDTSYDTIYVC